MSPSSETSFELVLNQLDSNSKANLIKVTPENGRAPLPESLYESLLSDNMKVKDYKEAIKLLDERFQYVFPVAMAILGRFYDWYDYNNGYDEVDGSFDFEQYSQNIAFEGEVKKRLSHGEMLNFHYEEEIPTKWLFESFEEKLLAEVAAIKADFVEKENKKKEELNDRKKFQEAVKTSILSKLTPEELQYIDIRESPKPLPKNKKNKRKP